MVDFLGRDIGYRKSFWGFSVSNYFVVFMGLYRGLFVF